jgi:endonuclease/exonuclease/phosphatase family metal-dependent hydrolase
VCAWAHVENTVSRRLREAPRIQEVCVHSDHPLQPGNLLTRAAVTGLLTIACAIGAASHASAQTPFSGSPASVPGTIQAEDFDEGGEGVAYHDTTPGNSGGQYRGTDVDIELCSNGGYDVGWTTGGEWLNYTVNVAAQGSYTVQLQVASLDGATMHVGFNGPSSVWSSVSIPSTGGWQTWTTVSIPVTLGAGVQQLTLMFDDGSANLDSVTVADASGGGPSGSGAPVVVTWNIDSVESGYNTAEHARNAMDVITQLSPLPQIIVLQEALQSQFNTYIDELQGRTGLTWTGVFAVHCAPDGWTGDGCWDTQDEGVGILTSLPMVDASTTYLPFPDEWHSARAAVRAAVDINGRVTQVFGAHMSNTTDARYGMMASLVGYALQFPGPQLVGGDFNADPDQIDAPNAMGAAFLDAWSVVGSGPGYTADTSNPTMHLDYLFTDFSGLIQPSWAVVIADAGWLSDHYPVLASFVVY